MYFEKCECGAEHPHVYLLDNEWKKIFPYPFFCKSHAREFVGLMVIPEGEKTALLESVENLVDIGEAPPQGLPEALEDYIIWIGIQELMRAILKNSLH